MTTLPSYSYRAVVVRIVDGDTIRVDLDLGLHVWQRNMPLRLLGYDAPEVRGEERPQGLLASAALAELLPIGTEIIVETRKGDGFGRYLAQVWKDGEDINAIMAEDLAAKANEAIEEVK